MYSTLVGLFRRLFQTNKYVKNHPEYIKVALESGNLRARISLLEDLVEKQRKWLSDSTNKSTELENRAERLETKFKKIEKEQQRRLQGVLDTLPSIPCVLMDWDRNIIYTNEAAKEYLKNKQFSEDDPNWNCASVSGGYVYTSDKTFAEKLRELYRFLVSCVTSKPVQHDAKTEIFRT